MITYFYHVDFSSFIFSDLKIVFFVFFQSFYYNLKFSQFSNFHYIVLYFILFYFSKIQSADLAIQVDEERKKIFVLRRRLQKYAEKMAAMELATVVQGLQKHPVVLEE